MSADLQAKAWRIHELLLTRYGQPQLRERLDPLSELVLTILSQNTADINSHRAYEALRARFPTWEEVLAAGVEEVAEVIRPGGLANVKAPRIQHILRQLAQERGALTLDFLAAMTVEEARQFLLALPGVGPKTAACVLLFSLQKPAFPVDTHVHRVTLRLGLLPAKTSAEQAHLLLEELAPPEVYFPFHVNLIRHGRTVCHASRPRCQACPLVAECDDLNLNRNATRSVEAPQG